MQALKLFCFVLGLSTFNAAQADIIAVKGGIDIGTIMLIYSSQPL